MKLAETLSPYREAFLRLFYPSLCAVCRKLLELEEKSLCPGCLGGFEKYKLEPSEERIRQTLGYGDEAWALFRYEGPVKEILHQVKFERHRDLLLLFEPALVDFFLRRSGIAVYDEIWSIPLDFRRRLEREFNQSELVARKVRGILRKEGKENALRKRLTLPQSLLGREARRWNLDGAFHLRNAKEASGKSILLVDDIFTTGATLEVAAKILKRAGAFRVGYLVLARTLARSEEPQVPRMFAVPGQPGPGTLVPPH